MVEFTWIKMFLFLILLLQFTAVTGQLSIIVSVGGEVTLPCENVIDGQDKCDGNNWTFSDSVNTVKLVTRGQILNDKSGRLSVTENCSLVLKKVTVEDVGRYVCRQFDKSGNKQGSDSQVFLAAVSLTEQKDNNKVTLSCSVTTHDPCRHRVKWLFERKHEVVETHQSQCSVTVSFPSSHLKKTSQHHDLFKCEVTDGFSKKVQLFNFSAPSSGEDTIIATKKTIEDRKKTANDENDAPPTPQIFWWLYIVVAVGLATLLITVVAIIIWKKTKGNNTEMDKNAGQRLNPEPQLGPGISRDTANPEDGVSYASVSYVKKKNSKAQVQVKEDDDDAVTYSTLKASSSSAGAFTDPSDLYATVNKPDK